MGLIRFVKRNYRRWKYLLYFVGLICIIQIFALSSSDSSSSEMAQIKQFYQQELQKNHEAANALLQGGKSNILKEKIQLNPKDPRFRNGFLQHVNNQKGIGVLEDKSLNGQNFQIVLDPAIHYERKPETDGNFKYQPVCDVTLKDAQSALSRAKLAQCKQEISDIACKMQEKDLFPASMPRTCPHQSKFVAQAPMPKSFDDSLSPVRICFMLVVHGRSFRQFRRLLRVIYHRDHYYYIHVDERSDYLMREIIAATKQYPNVKVAPWRMATIWGGASLLQMLLRAMQDVLFLWHDWDFFINLSGLDFPIASNDKLIKFLSTYSDKNFMKSHGRDDEKFIRKQGLDRVFVECEQHMWRLGKRDLPNGIKVNGGSDWLALNRLFCNFIVNGKDELLDSLKHWYKYTLLPAESFFHTLVQNSEFCETFVDNNLRVTNWNRARGCKCQYKHIVDWCGCSPNDFYPSDLVRLQTARPVFFARKFEEIVNQEVVNHLDFKLYGEYPSYTPALTSYWENCYNHLDGPSSLSDAHLSHYSSFARLGLADLNKQLGYQDNEQCALEFDSLFTVEIFKRSEQFSGYIVTIGATWGEKKTSDDVDHEPDVKIQTLISHQNTFRIIDGSSSVASRLKTASVGTSWDVKELILRDWGGIIGPNSSPHLVSRWRRGDEDSVVTVVVIDPLNVVTDYSDFRTPSKSAGVTDTPLSIRKPMRPGRWTVKFYLQRQFTKVFAEVNFFVAPLQFVKATEGHSQLSVDNRGVEDDAHVNAANRNLYTIRTTLSLTKDLEALHNLVSNSAHLVGARLKSWVDSVLGQAWKVKDVCFVSKSPYAWKDSQPERCRRQRQMSPNRCVNMNWSSFSPDPKSELGPVKADGRIR